MSVTLELLEALKASQGNCSDYRAAKILGVAQPQICKYRNGERHLSPEKVLLICEMTGLDGVDWLLKLYRERAKCTKEIEAIDMLRSRAAAGSWRLRTGFFSVRLLQIMRTQIS